MTKIAGTGSAPGSALESGSGSISRRHGSANPDPDLHQKCHEFATLILKKISLLVKQIPKRSMTTFQGVASSGKVAYFTAIFPYIGEYYFVYNLFNLFY
jgi:hypothetical protein